MSTPRRTIPILTLALLAVVVATLATTSATATPNDRRILYVSGGDIHSIRPDGTSDRRLTFTANNGQPAWSPAGTKIAFVSMRDGDREIFTMNADGSGLRKLTNNHRIDTQPAWSPDGRTIAFIRDYTFLRYDQDPTVGAALWLMAASGANPRRIPLHGGVFDTFFEALYQPVWAPDGQHIAGMGIEWIPTQDYALWVFDLSGNPTAILPGHYDAPAWASDGDAVGCSYDGIHKLAAIDATYGDLLVPLDVCSSPSMSGGLRFAVYAAGGTLRGRRLADGNDVALATLRPSPAPGPWDVWSPYDWSPNGRLLVAATPAGLLVTSPDASLTRLLPVTGRDPDW